MAHDDDYSRAGLLPPSFVLRARTREERREYSGFRQEVLRVFMGEDQPWLAVELTTWVDWQFRIVEQVAKKLDIGHSNPAWWAVRCEENRRMVIAAHGGKLPWQK